MGLLEPERHLKILRLMHEQLMQFLVDHDETYGFEDFIENWDIAKKQKQIDESLKNQKEFLALKAQLEEEKKARELVEEKLKKEYEEKLKK